MSGSFQPGASVRFTNTARVTGTLFSPTPTPTLTVHSPDGLFYTPTVVSDGTGLYHADFSIPVTAPAGTWHYRWRSVGADPTNTGNRDDSFQVIPLGF